MRAAADPFVLVQQLGGERHGDQPALPDAGRPVEEVRVRGPLGERRLEERLRLSLLRHVRHAENLLGDVVHRPVAAERDNALGKSPASCR